MKRSQIAFVVWIVAIVGMLAACIISMVNWSAQSNIKDEEEMKASNMRISGASLASFILFFVTMFASDVMRRS